MYSIARHGTVTAWKSDTAAVTAMTAATADNTRKVDFRPTVATLLNRTGRVQIKNCSFSHIDDNCKEELSETKKKRP